MFRGYKSCSSFVKQILKIKANLVISAYARLHVAVRHIFSKFYFWFS